MNDSQIESPCTGVCTLDNGGYCLGCRRTGAEIAAWMMMDEQERHELLNQLRERVAD